MIASPLIDEICAGYVGEDRIVVTLAPGENPRAFSAVRVLFNYEACDRDGGISFPIEVAIVSPSPPNCIRQIIRSGAEGPSERTFTPREGGPHMVLIRELYHNLWFGKLRVDVAGERLRMASSL